MSVSITKTDVTNVAPELASETTERINFFIDFARTFVCESKWGTKAKLATTVMAAHLATLSNRNGNSGAITSEKVGDYSQNYGPGATGSDSELSQTAYGTQFLMLRKTLVTTPLIVG